MVKGSEGQSSSNVFFSIKSQFFFYFDWPPYDNLHFFSDVDDDYGCDDDDDNDYECDDDGNDDKGLFCLLT